MNNTLFLSCLLMQKVYVCQAANVYVHGAALHNKIII